MMAVVMEEGCVFLFSSGGFCAYWNCVSEGHVHGIKA